MRHTQTWEEIQQSAWQRFKGFEDQAWANFNEKTKVEAKDFKAFYERMKKWKTLTAEATYQLMTTAHRTRVESSADVPAHTKLMNLDTKRPQKKSTGQALRS